MSIKKGARHEDFARRFSMACDDNPKVPEPNFGRLGYFTSEFKKRFGVDITPETIRKWGAGLSRPHPYAKMVQLAEILGVDVAWLATGASEGVTKKEARVRNAEADGAVNFIAGLVQMSGSHVAFPGENDRFAEENHVDLYAIIRGVQHAFHVAAGREQDGEITFYIPNHIGNAIILGVVPRPGMIYEVVWLDSDSVEETGERRGELLRVTLGEVSYKPVTTFAEKF